MNSKETTWIETYTGKKVNPFYPKAEDIDIEDIIHALSMKCRFTGHCNQFMSVAEHSILVSNFCSNENKLYGLLHDAGEAYLPDVARPLKPFISGFKEIENNLLGVILNKFGLKSELPEEVKLIDGKMCLTEAKQLGFDVDLDEWEVDIFTGKDVYEEVELMNYNWVVVKYLFRNELLFYLDENKNIKNRV